MNQIIILTCTNLVFTCFTSALTYAIQVLSQADNEVKRYQLILNRQEEGVILRSQIDNKILFMNEAATEIYANAAPEQINASHMTE